MPNSRRQGIIGLIAILVLQAGCDGPQSALSPAGRQAEQIASLFWWMAGGATLIWVIVVGLATYSIVFKQGSYNRRLAAIYIIGGGALVPTIILTVLLVFGLSLLPGLVDRAPPGSLEVEVVASQWWWQVRYGTGTDAVETANEIRLPVGEPVDFQLGTTDVIHSFWIPSLGGKMDMLPGRRTHLTLLPTKTGVYRGVCAEYCGTSHALMCFDVLVLEKEEYARWLDAQRQPARRPPQGSAAERGLEVFLQAGCGACHTVRGTAAQGRIAPDLTHFAGRRSLAAGTLANSEAALRRWITEPQQIKPGALMPPFHALAEQQLDDLVAYLRTLE